MTNTRKQAEHLASKGRYGDDVLVHMNRQEVAGLQGIASLAGRNLTVNPHTGMPEAFNLFDILPIVLNFIPGIGTAASIALSAASGAASASVDGRDPLQGALMGGVSSGIGSMFGGAGSAAGGLESAASRGVVNPAIDAATQAATQGAGSAVGNAAGDAIGSAAADELAKKAAEEAAASGIESVARSGITNAAPEAGGFLGDLFGSGGAETGIDRWLADPISKANLPYTLGGGAVLASLLPPSTMEEDAATKEARKPHLRMPGPPREYTPYQGNFSTYGQTGSQNPGEANYFTNNPGPYTGDAYTGDPYAFKFKDGGPVGYGNGAMVAMANAKAIRDRGAASDAQTPPSGWWRGEGGSAPMPSQTSSSGKGSSGGKGSLSDVLARIQAAKSGKDHVATTQPVSQPVQQASTPQSVTTQAPPVQPMTPVAMPQTPHFAGGGIASMRGKVDPRMVQQLTSGEPARHIQGEDPGMADSVPAQIDGKKPAKLSSGEVVIPADVVSMLGDGNTQAGAAMLRGMVQRVRQTKTGNPEQAPQIDPRSVMPA